jgi:hypothetical protein
VRKSPGDLTSPFHTNRNIPINEVYERVVLRPNISERAKLSIAPTISPAYNSTINLIVNVGSFRPISRRNTESINIIPDSVVINP